MENWGNKYKGSGFFLLFIMKNILFRCIGFEIVSASIFFSFLDPNRWEIMCPAVHSLKQPAGAVAQFGSPDPGLPNRFWSLPGEAAQQNKWPAETSNAGVWPKTHCKWCPLACFTSSSFLLCVSFNAIIWSLHFLWIHKESGNLPELAKYPLTPRTRMCTSLLWRNRLHMNLLVKNTLKVGLVKLHRGRILQNLHYSNQTN